MKNWMKVLPLSALLFSATIVNTNASLAQETTEQEKAEEQGLFYWAQKPVSCTSGEKIVEIMSEYGESPTIWMEGTVGHPTGVLTQSRFVIAMNQKAKPVTWTIIEFTDGGTQGCILGHGTGKINIGQLLLEPRGTKT